MDGLDPKLIKALMSGRKITKKAQRFALIRTEDGIEKVPLKNLEPGEFHGKVGTTRRSRKGRTYKAPNGSRKFQPNWEQEVVAYTSSKG